MIAQALLNMTVYTSLHRLGLGCPPFACFKKNILFYLTFYVLFSLQSALVFGSFCFGLDFFGMFFGTSLFNPGINILQIIFHFIGGIFLSWVITDIWDYRAIWPIVISCNLPTALVEGVLLFLIFGLKVIVY